MVKINEGDAENETEDLSSEQVRLLPSSLRSVFQSISPSRTPRVSRVESRDLEAGSGGDEEVVEHGEGDGPAPPTPPNIYDDDRQLREAIYKRDVCTVKWLLARGAPLTPRGNRGQTPLQYCLGVYYYKDTDYSPHEYTKELEIVKAIVSKAHGNSDILECLDKDRYTSRTALFYAVDSGYLEFVKLMLAAGANMKKVAASNETVLHVATRSRRHHILKYFLDNHDIPNTPESHGFYPIHFAVISHELESVKLLVDKFGYEQLDYCNNNKETSWHRLPGIEIANYLFNSGFKFNLNALDKYGRTPLYHSAHNGRLDLNKLLLSNGATLSVKDEKESAVKCISQENNSLQFFEELFDRCINEDNEIDYSVLAGSEYNGLSQIKVLEDLVKYGQSKILKHPTIESLIFFKWRCLLPIFYIIIITNVAFVIPFNVFVISTFSDIDTRNVTCNTTVCNATSDGGVSHDNVTCNTTVCNATSDGGVSHDNVTCNTTVCNATSDGGVSNDNVTCNTTVCNATSDGDVSNDNVTCNTTVCNATSDGGVYDNVTCNMTSVPCVYDDRWGAWYWTLVVLIYASTTVLIAQEFFWLQLQRYHHFRHLETWVKLGAVISALAVPVILACSATPGSMSWQRHVACVALMLAWLQAMLLLSRFPGWGYYVLMLERVAINILKILATTIVIVIGFSSCLMIQYQSKPPFDGPLAAFIKTLVMMLSEFDYSDLFDESHNEIETTKFIVQIFFVIFVIFVAIVLMNFIVGVAVSDVNELNEIGNIRRLEKQVELLSKLEGLGDTVLAKWWRRLLLIRFHKGTGYSHGTKWYVDDLYDEELRNDADYFKDTFNPELHNAVLAIAKKNKRDADKIDPVFDGAGISTRTTLDDFMVSMEDATKDQKRCITEIRNDVDRILKMMTDCVKNKSRVVSSKLGRKRKLKRKK